MHKNFWVLIIILALIAGAAFFATRGKEKVPSESNQSAEVLLGTNYTDAATGLSFAYPNAWNAPEEAKGNPLCPEEDTYRSPETLAIFDRELKFKNIGLEGTDSFIESGIRFYKLTPGVSNNCNDALLQSLAQKKITGAEISSVRLVPVQVSGFYGVHNEGASRLDTEYREQYTFFKDMSDGSILVIQPYLSFVPYFNSPEWQEIEQKYRGNISAYARGGASAGQLQANIKTFRQMAESFKLELRSVGEIIP